MLLIGGAVALGGGALLVPWPSGTAARAEVSNRELFTVHRDDLAITIVENGTIVAKESQKVIARIRSEGKITFLVEEGRNVAEGEVVCRLDAATMQSQLEQVQLDFLQTEVALKSAVTELEIQTVENTANLAKAKVALEKAGKELEKYQDGQAPQERRKLEVAIKDTETEFNRAQKNLADSKQLLEQNYIKKSELEDHQIAFEKATVQKEGAELDLKIFDKYTFPMTMTELQTKLADAQREVATVQKRGESTLGQKQVAVQQAEKRVKMQTTQLAEKQEEIENMVLRAPCPGIVVYGDPHNPWMRTQIHVGGSAYSGQPVLTIPDLRVMQVKVQIHEADIDKVKVGLLATVTTETYPGLLLHGEVSRIASVANGENDWGGPVEVKKFDVEITLKTDAGLHLRPGISAKAEIHVDKRPGTLFVPLQSVFAEGGEHFCHVLQPGGGPVRRRVEIGSSNDTYVEVTAGLNEHEAVLLYNPSLPEAGRKRPDEKTPAPARSS
jgi:HlyD family secretion protein